MSLASQAHADHQAELFVKRAARPPLRKEVIHGSNCAQFIGFYEGIAHECPAYISRVSSTHMGPPKFDVILLDDFTLIAGLDVDPSSDDPVRECLRATSREKAVEYVTRRREKLLRDVADNYPASQQDSLPPEELAPYTHYFRETESLGF